MSTGAWGHREEVLLLSCTGAGAGQGGFHLGGDNLTGPLKGEWEGVPERGDSKR